MATGVVRVGRVDQVWRYPVKSMQGESLPSCPLTPRGFEGDRAFALVDAADGTVVSAKNPRKWKGILHCQARRTGGDAEITLPDGEGFRTDDPNIGRALSRQFGREVALSATPTQEAEAENLFPEEDGSEALVRFRLPAGAFQDEAPVHLLTTSTLAELTRLCGGPALDVRRYRPNLFIDTGEEGGFVEDSWAGRVLHIGEGVRLGVTGPCPRCVMTTLDQPGLPGDPGILRAAARHHEGNIGVLVTVREGGVVHVGEEVWLE